MTEGGEKRKEEVSKELEVEAVKRADVDLRTQLNPQITHCC